MCELFIHILGNWMCELSIHIHGNGMCELLIHIRGNAMCELFKHIRGNRMCELFIFIRGNGICKLFIHIRGNRMCELFVHILGNWMCELNSIISKLEHKNHKKSLCQCQLSYLDLFRVLKAGQSDDTSAWYQLYILPWYSFNLFTYIIFGLDFGPSWTWTKTSETTLVTIYNSPYIVQL